jgi:hypothetical protein
MMDVNSPPPSTSLTGSMDERLSALLSSSSQFSVASYLNLALESSSDDSDELQQRMAELALQLQLQTQTCHEDIGRIGAELQAILPRCAADVGRVGVGLEGMRLDAHGLLEATAVANEQQGLSGSLETLSTLHALQSNLSRTKAVLTAAATWDSTMSSIPPLLAQQNLTEAVNALAQLENGERALRGMPNPEERQESIAKIRQQVQVMLQPQLKHALQNMNTRLGPLQQCVALYTKLDKMDSLREEYVKNRPGSAHKAWFAYSPSYASSSIAQEGAGEGSDSGNGSDSRTSESFDVWLPTWYDTVLSLLTEERRQASSVFGPEAAPEIIVKVRKLAHHQRAQTYTWSIPHLNYFFLRPTTGYARMLPSHLAIISKPSRIFVFFQSVLAVERISRDNLRILRVDLAVPFCCLRVGSGCLFGCS